MDSLNSEQLKQLYTIFQILDGAPHQRSDAQQFHAPCACYLFVPGTEAAGY